MATTPTGMQREVIVNEFKRILSKRSALLAKLKETESGELEMIAANQAADRAYAETMRFSEGFELGIIMALSEETRDELRAEAVRQLRSERSTR